MKKLFLFVAITTACATLAPFVPPGTGMTVIHAQTLPYTVTVAWDPVVTGTPSPTTYNCWLDNVKVVSNVSVTTCSFPVSTKGNHVAGVSTVNNDFVPNESAQGTVAFILQAPAAPGNLKVR